MRLHESVFLDVGELSSEKVGVSRGTAVLQPSDLFAQGYSDPCVAYYDRPRDRQIDTCLPRPFLLRETFAQHIQRTGCGSSSIDRSEKAPGEVKLSTFEGTSMPSSSHRALRAANRLQLITGMLGLGWQPDNPRVDARTIAVQQARSSLLHLKQRLDNFCSSNIDKLKRRPPHQRQYLDALDLQALKKLLGTSGHPFLPKFSDFHIVAGQDPLGLVSKQWLLGKSIQKASQFLLAVYLLHTHVAPGIGMDESESNAFSKWCAIVVQASGCGRGGGPVPMDQVLDDPVLQQLAAGCISSKVRSCLLDASQLGSQQSDFVWPLLRDQWFTPEVMSKLWESFNRLASIDLPYLGYSTNVSHDTFTSYGQPHFPHPLSERPRQRITAEQLAHRKWVPVKYDFLSHPQGPPVVPPPQCATSLSVAAARRVVAAHCHHEREMTFAEYVRFCFASRYPETESSARYWWDAICGGEPRRPALADFEALVGSNVGTMVDWGLEFHEGSNAVGTLDERERRFAERATLCYLGCLYPAHVEKGLRGLRFRHVAAAGRQLYMLFDIVPFCAWWMAEQGVVLPYKDYVWHGEFKLDLA